MSSAIRSASPRPAATITWHTYGRRPTKEQTVAGLNSSLYSSHVNGTPFFHLGLRLPIPYAHPYGFESQRSLRTRSTHLVRTERFIEAWLNREGYPYELVGDFDLHQEPDLLSRFQALVIVVLFAIGSWSGTVAERHFGRALKSFSARVATGADDPFTRYYIACLHALRGDAVHALDSLERVARSLPELTAARARVDVDLASLRNEPRFRVITRT